MASIGDLSRARTVRKNDRKKSKPTRPGSARSRSKKQLERENPSRIIRRK